MAALCSEPIRRRALTDLGCGRFARDQRSCEICAAAVQPGLVGFCAAPVGRDSGSEVQIHVGSDGGGLGR